MAGKGAGRKSKKREDLLQAAEQLLLEEGVRPVTVEKIIHKAQVSNATFYKHFRNKRDILDQVLHNIYTHALRKLEQTLVHGKQKKMTKEDFLNIFDMDKYEKFFRSDFSEELMRDYPDIVMKNMSRMLEEMFPLFHDLIRMAKVDGIVRMDVDTDFLIVYSFAMRKAMRQALAENPHMLEKMGMKQFLQMFYDLYLHGVVER